MATDFDPMMATAVVTEVPVKGAGDVVSLEAAERQAVRIRAHVVRVPKRARGTCRDEREREGLASGEETVEVRPSVDGGPNLYGLAVAELTGYFGDAPSSGEERLAEVTQVLEDSDEEILSGGHQDCAANGKLGVWLGRLSDPSAKEKINDAMRNELGDEYDSELAHELFGHADATNQSGRYANWDETVLPRVLGDEAGQAIERLAPIKHDAKTLARNHIEGTTVHQNGLHEDGQNGGDGERSFVFDDWYAAKIEGVLSTGPEAGRMLKLARHARAAIVAAVNMAVPNPELYEVIIKN